MGSEKPTPATPRDGAPLDIAALPDWWDAQRALDGKPDASTCAAELRRALEHRAPSGSLRAVAEEMISVDARMRRGEVSETYAWATVRDHGAKLAAEVIGLEARLKTQADKARAFRVAIENLVETDGCSCQCDCGPDLIARAFEHYDECEAASSGSLCLAHMIEPLLHVKQEDSPDGR